jgi:hypothetical protein
MKKLQTKLNRKPKPDFNQVAQDLVRRSTEAPGPVEVSQSDISRVMRELGSRGGKKGGVSRMALLTDAERRDLASKAGRARWDKRATVPA